MYISTTSLRWDSKQGHNNIEMSSFIIENIHNESEALRPLEIWPTLMHSLNKNHCSIILDSIWS